MNKSFFCFFLLSIAIFPSAIAQKSNSRGIAIVIANSQYRQAEDTLHCPRTEGLAVANRLSELGYQVFPFFDATHDEMLSGIQMVAEQSKYYPSIIVYYTGHGVLGMSTCDSLWSLQNFLVPVDGKVRTNSEVSTTCISLTSIIQMINRSASSSTKRIIFIDACRVMPSCGIASIYGDPYSGLRLTGYENFWTFFSTEDGQLASDGNEQYGPYATAWLEASNINGLSLKDFAQYLNSRVPEINGKQHPAFTRARYEFVINPGIGNSFPNNKTFTLEKCETKRSNWGKKLYVNGDWYEGYLLDGEEHGYGIRQYANGNRYEGNWENGKRSGGSMYYANGDEYHGGWRMDLKDGTGYFYSGDSLRFGLWYADSCYEGDIYNTDDFSFRTGKGHIRGFHPKRRPYFSAEDGDPNHQYISFGLWYSRPSILGLNVAMHAHGYKLGLEAGLQLTEDPVESRIVNVTDYDSSISIRDTGRATFYALTGSYSRKYMSFTLSIGVLVKHNAYEDHIYNRLTGTEIGLRYSNVGESHVRFAITPSIQLCPFPDYSSLYLSIGYRWVIHEQRYSGIFLGIGFH